MSVKDRFIVETHTEAKNICCDNDFHSPKPNLQGIGSQQGSIEETGIDLSFKWGQCDLSRMD